MGDAAIPVQSTWFEQLPQWLQCHQRPADMQGYPFGRSEHESCSEPVGWQYSRLRLGGQLRVGSSRRLLPAQPQQAHSLQYRLDGRRNSWKRLQDLLVLERARTCSDHICCASQALTENARMLIIQRK